MILVHGHGFELERQLRDNVREKIAATLGRFLSRIERVTAYLTDVNGPKKGLDKSLRLVIDIERHPVIVVEQKGADWQSILESVSDRAASTVTRQIARVRSRKGRKSLVGKRKSSFVPSIAVEDTRFDRQWNPLRDRDEREWNPLRDREDRQWDSLRDRDDRDD